MKWSCFEDIKYTWQECKQVLRDQDITSEREKQYAINFIEDVLQFCKDEFIIEGEIDLDILEAIINSRSNIEEED